MGRYKGLGSRKKLRICVPETEKEKEALGDGS